jgi:hypothetical protein
VAEVRPGLARVLPRDVAAVVKVTYAVFRREPQLRALLLQQLVFFAVPIVLQAGSNKDRAGGGDDFFPFMVAMMIVLSHASVALSFLGVDGRGLAALFASPVSRVRLLLGRVIALLGIFAAADLLAAVAITSVVRWMRGSFEGAWFEGATLFGVVLAGDAAQLACGAVTSVLAPMAVVRARRGASARMGREGCVSVIGRMFALLPVAACAAAASALALAPRWFNLGPAWFAVSLPVAALFVAALVVAGVTLGAHYLRTREGKVLDALVDTGE